MKQKYCVLSVMLTCLISMFTSCVQSDMYEFYDEDGSEWFSPRRKGTKDVGPQQSSNVYQDPYYHRLNKSITSNCGSRSLDSKFPGKWRDNVILATQARYYWIEKHDPEYLPTFVQKNYSNGSVDVDKVLGGTDGLERGIMEFIIQMCGGNESDVIGSICFISHYNHYVHILSMGSGGEASYYVDMDGNVWDGRMLEKL